MPGGSNGLDLAREIRRRRPGLPVVLTTGNSEAAARMRGVEFRLLLKPYTSRTDGHQLPRDTTPLFEEPTRALIQIEEIADHSA